MGSDFGILWGIVGTLVGVAAVILIFIYVFIPILKGVGKLVTSIVWLITALIGNIFRFIVGELKDALRIVGSIFAGALFSFLSVGNVIIGRWSSSAHYGAAVQNEIKTAGACIYRMAIGHPLRLFSLETALEGVEQRLPQAMAQAPGADRPSRRAGLFEGYNIVGSLPAGGSGGRLYIAEPSKEHRDRITKLVGACPDRVVIKSFAIADGSSLPQIVRESRALESAKQIGLVLEHQLTAERFYYVMPYVAGDSLGQVVRNLHGQTGDEGLGDPQLAEVLGYMSDLLRTLDTYHRSGFWHKDIKPDNILVQNGRAEVVDFGLITPLRSAMTLTTHGTEYFRDPEMVRMALRGVKVHEVDGVKFDLYAAGAVLYYALENTFPMHGGLSSISKRCPDSVKWIVRRAMTDYNHRYESSGLMLADIECVRRSSDLFAVKMADLPSMRAGSQEPLVQPAASPMPWAPAAAIGAAAIGAIGAAAAAAPPAAAAAVGAGGAALGAGANVIGAGVGAVGNAAASLLGRNKPRLQVLNWWTGAYRTAPAEVPNVPVTDQFRSAGRDAASAAQRFSHNVRNDGMFHAVGQVASGVADAVKRESHGWRSVGVHGEHGRTPDPAGKSPSGRASARDQVSRAQSRAALRRSQALGRSPAYAPSERINPGMAIAACVVLFFALSYGVGTVKDIVGRRASRAQHISVVTTAPGISPAIAPTIHQAVLDAKAAIHSGDASLKDALKAALQSAATSSNGFIVIDGAHPGDFASAEDAAGYETPEVPETPDVETEFLPTLEDVWNSRPATFVVVNNHPAFRSEKIESAIAQAVANLSDAGLTRIDDLDLEARIKTIMAEHAAEAADPTIGKPADSAATAIHDALASSGKTVGLVLWVYAVSGEADQVRYWINVPQDPDPEVLAVLSRTLAGS